MNDVGQHAGDCREEWILSGYLEVEGALYNITIGSRTETGTGDVKSSIHQAMHVHKTFWSPGDHMEKIQLSRYIPRRHLFIENQTLATDLISLERN